MENCYIADKNNENVIVIGNCCIKSFLSEDKSGRTCEKCGSPHKNRVCNRCNSCRSGICDRCGKEIDKKYKLCHPCKFGNEYASRNCDRCGGNKTDKNYKLCYSCRFANEDAPGFCDNK